MFSQRALGCAFLLFILLTCVVFSQHLYQDQIPLNLKELGENTTSEMAHHGHGQEECDGFRTVAYFVNWVRDFKSLQSKKLLKLSS
jgi:hypothetical protein